MVTQSVTRLLASANKYLKKALVAREAFYEGQEEAATRARMYDERPIDAKYRYAKSVKGLQQIADNKWNMEQAQTFSLAAMGETMSLLLAEQRETNNLLRQISDKLNEMQVY